MDQAPAVRALRNELARWMLHSGIRQWNPGEMPLEWIETCISWGAVHVVTHNDRVDRVGDRGLGRPVRVG